MNIGVDVGTSVTKTVLFDRDGITRAVRSVRTDLNSPARGHYEYDIDQMALSVVELLRGLSVREVDVIALTGQGDGLCLTAPGGHAVAPGISWLDNRGAGACEEWAASGALAKVYAITGNAPFPGAGAALLASFDATSPELLDHAATATQCQAALFERLTGVRATTRSCVMLPVFDPVAGAYSTDALALLGLQARRGLLPPIVKEAVAVAPVLDGIADAIGIERGTRIATGPYDLPAAALGAGLAAFGDGLLILGTTLACEVLVGHVTASGDPAGLTLVAGNGRGYLRAMPAMVGTACLDWALNLVKAHLSDLDRLLSASAPGANGMRALPYLSPSGERAPFLDLAARAELSGLTLETTAADVVRALCESLAYAARHCFEAAGLTGDVYVCGGGTNSAALLQIVADVLGRPLRVKSGELGALGAVRATWELAGLGNVPAHELAALVTPNTAVAHVYDDGYSDYLAAIDLAGQRWHRQAGQLMHEQLSIATPLAKKTTSLNAVGSEAQVSNQQSSKEPR